MAGPIFDDPDLDAQIHRLAATPQLLVACDYDGTIAPIVSDPMKALPLRDTSVALRGLAAQPQTHVAVISGRSLRDLAALSRLPAEIHLVGSHGSEFDVDFALELDPALQDRRSELGVALEEVRVKHPALKLEKKPASVAVHYRNIDDSTEVNDILGQLDSLAANIGDLTVRHGKEVCELLLVPTDKGDALNTVRSTIGATAVVFIGDDATDEHAFATLHGPDVGIKVGDEESAAEYRVGTPQNVAALLALLSARRAEWLAGNGVTEINKHSLLSDQRTAALLTPEARITWLCFPRVDSSAIFAELIGGSTAGHFSISPVQPEPTSPEAALDSAPPPYQRYVDNTLTVLTSWPDMTVTDYLDCSEGRPYRTAGRTDLVRVLEGTAMARIEFAPRLDFGRFPTRLEVHDGGLEVANAADLIVLRSPGVEWEVLDMGVHQTAVARVDLSQGPVTLELRCGTASLRPFDAGEAAIRSATNAFWSDWCNKLDIPEELSERESALVRRSALTLKALCYGPTGAIVAAATTSLPEFIGGVRNWDYRYCWIRDASLAASALVRLGSTDEATDLLDWLVGLIESSELGPERLAPLYTVTGQSLPPEATIEELAGYAGSRPVRVGNAADHQVQLDVFGPVVDLIHQLGAAHAPLSTNHWRLIESLVAAVEHRWNEPDQGIWEVRSAPRHHVNSKVMCWVTVDRAVKVAREVFGRERPEWEELAEQIRTSVLTEGWSETSGSFTTAYDGDDLDASVLVVGLYGLVPPTDPKFVSTLEAVEGSLREGDIMYRYKHEDGLPGREGGFNLMTSWLIDAKIAVGDIGGAESLFASYLELAGPTGLLSEEVNPETGLALGNHPQAYSHLGLISNAFNLAEARAQS